MYICSTVADYTVWFQGSILDCNYMVLIHGLQLQGLDFRVKDSKFEVQGVDFKVHDTGFHIQSFNFKVLISGFTFQGLGFKV